jgi:ATP-dependent Lon protease
MIEKGPERFQVKPSGLPVMDALPTNAELRRRADEGRRQLALCEDSRDALEITPLLLLGPPGVGKTHFAREIALLLGTGMGFLSMSSLTAGWVLSGASSQWKGARPGKVFETLVDGQYANPVMVVDEIDKAGGEHAYDPLGALTACSSTTPRQLHRRVRQVRSTRARSSGSRPRTTAARFRTRS